jgi:tetratricopeptide (TPR) repeat protein
MRALAVLLLWCATAVAAAPRDLAARHYRVGSARYAAGSYQTALAEFEAGYAAHPSPAFLVNIGQCLRKLDRLDEAALAFRRFLDARTGSARTRLDVWDALEDVLAELNRRVDRLAADAALFRAYLATSDGDTALRASVRAALDDIVRELVRIDDNLVGGYGVARGLALPRVQLPERASASGPEAVDHIHQWLATIAATSSPAATSTNQRSLRSASHSHIVR